MTATKASTYDPSQRVSYSSMTLHRTCPQAWNYRYVQGLSPVKGRHVLDLGSWWHLIRAFDSIAAGLNAGSLLVLPETLETGHGMRLRLVGSSDPEENTQPRYAVPSGTELPPSAGAALAVVKAYWRTLSADQKDEWIDAIGEPLPDRLEAMEARYQERWKAEDERCLPMAVELKVRAPLGEGDDAPMLTGVIDLIYFDAERNMAVVRDHKTAGSLPGADSEADLADSQLHLYAWAAQQWLNDRAEDGKGPKIRALSYDRVRTAKPKTPALTLTGRLSKGVSDYDLQTYLAFAEADTRPTDEQIREAVFSADDHGPEAEEDYARIREILAEPGRFWGTLGDYVKSGKNQGTPKFGVYRPEDDVIRNLQTPEALSVWHQRTLTPLNKRIIRTHLDATVYTQQAAERTMAYVEEHQEAPRNFNRWGCRNCDFRRLCQAQLIGGPVGDYPPEQFGLSAR